MLEISEIKTSKIVPCEYIEKIFDKLESQMFVESKNKSKKNKTLQKTNSKIVKIDCLNLSSAKFKNIFKDRLKKMIFKN